MFKSVNHFFTQVYKNKVSDIEIENYIESITNYNLKKLKILDFDLERYISDRFEELSNVKTEKIEESIKWHESIGLEIPKIKVPNIDYLYAQKNNLPLDNLSEFDEVLDIVELCSPYKLNTLKSLKSKIELLISDTITGSNNVFYEKTEFKNIKDFLSKIILRENLASNFSKIEINNYVTEITQNYNPEKVSIFIEDIEEFLKSYQLDWAYKVSQNKNEFEERKKRFIDIYGDIPYIYYEDNDGETKKTIDLEKMYYEYQLNNIKELLDDLKNRLNEKFTMEIEDIEHSTILEYYSSELSNYFFINSEGNELKYVDEMLQKLKDEFMLFIVNSKDDNSIEIKQKKRKLEIIIDFYETKKKSLQPLYKNTTPEIKTTNSLLLNGKKLNLSERYKIADKLLDIDNKIRTLNIKDLEKYQLLAYIFGCDKDNARDLMNGKYNSKDRDLTSFFNEIGLNK